MIETERLVIRRFIAGDWLDLYEYLSDQDVVKYEPYCVFTVEECQSECIRRTDDMAFWAVCLRESGKLVGNLYLAKQDFETYELGFVFNKKFQGQGYAYESSKTIIEFAFKSLGARRIVAKCNPDNEKSWRLIERLGLCREGRLRRNIYFKSDDKGQPIWLDTYLYGLLKDDWKQADGGITVG